MSSIELLLLIEKKKWKYLDNAAATVLERLDELNTQNCFTVFFVYLTYEYCQERQFINTKKFLLDVATEKSQKNLIATIEGFDSTKLKHAETQEKNPLPDKDG